MSLKITRSAKAGTAKISFTLPADFPPGPVSVVGTFNDWTPGVNALRKRGATRSTSVSVPLGEQVCFRYLGEGDAWFDDADGEPCEHGTCVSTA